MRILIQTAAYLLLASLAAGQPSVEVLEVHPSSQNARITVLQNGQRIQNVKVEVLAPDDRPRLSLSTDNRGAVVLPLLPPGTYHVVATASEGLGAELVLEISARKRRKPNSFSMELFLRPPPPPSLQDRIAAAERIAIAEQLQQFNGVVQDQVGAAISRCKIQVFQKGSVGGAPVLEGCPMKPAISRWLCQRESPPPPFRALGLAHRFKSSKSQKTDARTTYG